MLGPEKHYDSAYLSLSVMRPSLRSCGMMQLLNVASPSSSSISPTASNHLPTTCYRELKKKARDEHEMLAVPRTAKFSGPSNSGVGGEFRIPAAPKHACFYRDKQKREYCEEYHEQELEK